MALAYPEVSFEIVTEGKQVWYFAENESLKTRIHQIYGPEFAENCIPLSADTGTLKLS